MPISIGGSIVPTIRESTCNVSPLVIVSVFGSVVLLSDGTVKVPSSTGGYTTPDPAHGSLPSGVWHDIEGSFDSGTFPEGCFGPTFPRETQESLNACAVADTGDVYCINSFVLNGMLSGTGWTLQGNVLP